MDYNCHLEISEMLADGWTYEDACAWCNFVFDGDDEGESIHHTSVKRSMSERTKKWLEKTARKIEGENKNEDE